MGFLNYYVSVGCRLQTALKKNKKEIEMKKKLEIKDLKIQSFVTSLNPIDSEGVKGGATALSCEPEGCPTDVYPCIPYTYQHVYCTGLNGCSDGVDCTAINCP